MPGCIPVDCIQPEVLVIIAESAWWIGHTGGTSANLAVADTILDTVQPWLQPDTMPSAPTEV